MKVIGLNENVSIQNEEIQTDRREYQSLSKICTQLAI